jgi:diguanylate cyclase (GGDEF)-like protein
MTAMDQSLDFLAIGLDPFTIEGIKANLKEIKLKYRISFISDISELNSITRKNINGVFFYSNRQSQKTFEDIRRIHQHLPSAAVTLLAPKPDYYGMISAFRAGVFDFLFLPLDGNEVRTVIYRLKIHGAVQDKKWTPERAVLHLFSRPESFYTVEDVALSFNSYLAIFFEIKKETIFKTSDGTLSSLERKLRLSSHQVKRIHRFLTDDVGLIFGLRFIKDQFHFLIKRGEGKISYLVARNTSSYSGREILNAYLSNVLRTTLSILNESGQREKIRLLSLTDEVTGVFNQRKLQEDLEFHIARYKQDQLGFSLLFIDIDFFKNVNDRYGHVVGSQILIDLSKILKRQLRSSDLVYRYGGDEFIALLPRTNVEEAKKIAMRISDLVKASEFMINRSEVYRLSLSIGLAEFPGDATSAKSIIEFADKMMYMSKKSGRGKVFHVTEVIA